MAHLLAACDHTHAQGFYFHKNQPIHKIRENLHPTKISRYMIYGGVFCIQFVTFLLYFLMFMALIICFVCFDFLRNFACAKDIAIHVYTCSLLGIWCVIFLLSVSKKKPPLSCPLADKNSYTTITTYMPG